MKRLNILGVALITLIAVYAAIYLNPILLRDGRPHPTSWCMSNLKQLGTCTLIYLGDYNDRFPAQGWHDELAPYHKNDWSLLTCPIILKEEKKWGYAMNLDLMGANQTKLPDPGQTILFFETDALAPNVIANLAARNLNRHGSGSIVTRADSSTKFVRIEKP